MHRFTGGEGAVWAAQPLAESSDLSVHPRATAMVITQKRGPGVPGVHEDWGVPVEVPPTEREQPVPTVSRQMWHTHVWEAGKSLLKPFCVTRCDLDCSSKQSLESEISFRGAPAVAIHAELWNAPVELRDLRE